MGPASPLTNVRILLGELDELALLGEPASDLTPEPLHARAPDVDGVVQRDHARADPPHETKVRGHRLIGMVAVDQGEIPTISFGEHALDNRVVRKRP
jgi:hypothetical protein